MSKGLRKITKEIIRSQAKQLEKDRARYASNLSGQRLAAERGGRFIPQHPASAEAPRRQTGVYVPGPSNKAISSDSLPTPGPKKLAGAVGTGFALMGGVGLASTSMAGKRDNRDPPANGSEGPGSYRDPNGMPIEHGIIMNPRSTVVAPVAMSQQSKGHSPHIWASAKRGNVEVVVEHTEFVRDIVTGSSVALFSEVLQSLAINPGNPGVFSWMSDLANLFDTYKFEKLAFMYNPSVGTDTDGKMLMTFDPDISDDLPDTKQVMLESRIQSDTPPYAFQILSIPKDVLNTERFCRRGVVPVGNDPHIYDLGQLLVATPGAPTATTLGELFVKYRVVFKSPNGGQPLAGLIAATGSTLAAPLGTSFINSRGNLFPTWVSGTTFRIPVLGVFKLSLLYVGTGFAGFAVITAVAPNVIETSTVNNAGAGPLLGGYATTIHVCEYIITNNQVGLLYTAGTPAGAATLTGARFDMCAWDREMST